MVAPPRRRRRHRGGRRALAALALLAVLIFALAASSGSGFAEAAKRKSKPKKKKTGRRTGGRKKKVVTKKHYSLRLSIDEGTEAEVIEDLTHLLDFAKEKKLKTEALTLMLRTATQKMESSIRDRRKREERAAKRKRDEEKSGAGKVQAPAFTAGKRRVKDLKVQTRRCNMKTYDSEDAFRAAVSQGTVDMERPFVVRNASAAMASLTGALTSDNFRANKNVRVKYYEPKLAKVMMSQQQTGEGQNMEVFQPEMVTFAEYFSKCFSKSKRPGPDTEHCEQTIAALQIAELTGAGFDLTLFAGVDLRRSYERNLFEALEAARKGKSMRKLVGGSQAAQDVAESIESTSARKVVFGPSGSGSSMRQEGLPFADGLVHGARRWWVTSPEAYLELQGKAGDDFQPGSAFSFFEDMYSELVEEFGMKVSEEKGIYECGQVPGDIIYIPHSFVRTSLALQDSVSYKQELLAQQDHMRQYIDSSVWSPQMQKWGGALCLNSPAEYAEHLPGLRNLGLDPQELHGALQQQVTSPQLAASFVLPVVLNCISTDGSEGSVCATLRDHCVAKLRDLASATGASVSWLNKFTQSDL